MVTGLLVVATAPDVPGAGAPGCEAGLADDEVKAGAESADGGEPAVGRVVVCDAERAKGTVLPAPLRPGGAPCEEAAGEALVLIPAAGIVTPTETAGCVEAVTVVDAGAEVGPVTDPETVTEAEPVAAPEDEICAEVDTAGAETETVGPELPAGALTPAVTPVPGTWPPTLTVRPAACTWPVKQSAAIPPPTATARRRTPVRILGAMLLLVARSRPAPTTIEAQPECRTGSR